MICQRCQLRVRRSRPHRTPENCIEYARALVRRMRGNMEHAQFIFHVTETLCDERIQDLEEFEKFHIKHITAMEEALGPEVTC